MLNKVFERYPTLDFVKEIDGRGGYKNIFVKFTEKSSIAERGQLLMKLEDDLIREVSWISPYMTGTKTPIIEPKSFPISHDLTMEYGVYYSKSGGLLLNS